MNHFDLSLAKVSLSCYETGLVEKIPTQVVDCLIGIIFITLVAKGNSKTRIWL